MASIHAIGAPVYLVEVDPSGRFIGLEFNSLAEEYFGVTAESFVGRDLEDPTGLSDARILRRQRGVSDFRRCIEQGSPFTAEYQTPWEDETLRWGRFTFVPIFNESGEIRRIMTTITDITEFKESQKQLKTIMDTIGEPIMILDVKPCERFTFSILNRAAEQYFSVSNDEYSGMDLDNFEGLDATRIAQRKSATAVSKRCIATRAPVMSETKHLKRDGSYRWGRNTNAPIFDSNGKVHQIMVTSVDITELKETQEKLENSLTRMLSGFVKICATCKDIRNDSNQWVRVEHYLDNDAHDVKFSHGYCPKCFDLAMQEIK